MEQNKTMKRISEVVRPNPTFEGPYGNLPIHILSKDVTLLNRDFVLEGFSVIEGSLGDYVHILVSETEKAEQIVISTGSQSIVSKMKEVPFGSFPMLAKFVSGPGRGGNKWYDME